MKGAFKGRDDVRHYGRLQGDPAIEEVLRLSAGGGEDVGHLLFAQAAAFGADLLVIGA